MGQELGPAMAMEPGKLQRSGLEVVNHAAIDGPRIGAPGHAAEISHGPGEVASGDEVRGFGGGTEGCEDGLTEASRRPGQETAEAV